MQGPGRERIVHLVLENDRNEARRLARDASGRPHLFTAQWNDDIHHAAHALLTASARVLRRLRVRAAALARTLPRRRVRLPGRALALSRRASRAARRAPRCRPTAFVSFLQNHDQVGNRALGERLPALTRDDRLRAILAIMLLAPSPPLLFMGEEFAAATPFLFFCDFEPELAAAVTRGRREEFNRSKPQRRATVGMPFPTRPRQRRSSAASSTGCRSKREPHAGWLAFYRRAARAAAQGDRAADRRYRSGRGDVACLRGPGARPSAGRWSTAGCSSSTRTWAMRSVPARPPMRRHASFIRPRRGPGRSDAAAVVGRMAARRRAGAMTIAVDLQRVCAALGVEMSYRDIYGEHHAVPEATLRAIVNCDRRGGRQRRFPGPAPRSRRCAATRDRRTRARAACSVRRCSSTRCARAATGASATSPTSATLTEIAAAHGAELVGVNPLHALFSPGRAASPYSPSSRRRSIRCTSTSRPSTTSANPRPRRRARRRSVDAATDRPAARCAAGRLRGRRGGQARSVRASVRALSRPSPEGGNRACAKLSRVSGARGRGPSRPRHCSTRCASTSARCTVPAAGRVAEYRDPDSPAVAAFARAHVARIEFFEYLQWQADHQLAAVARRSRDAGMAIGLYRDLAVGANAGGAEAWRTPGLFARAMHVGAPPDEFNQGGQDWGLPPWIPQRLTAAGVFAVERGAARQHAQRRRAAHRSRHGPRAPVLDSRRSVAARRRVRALPVRRHAGRAGAGEPARALRRRRRGPRHRARRACARAMARAGDPVVPRAVFRAATATAFRAPAAYPAAGAR